MKKYGLGFLMVALLPGLVLIGCGPRQYSKGKYVEPDRVDLLSDKFVESDLQQMADELSAALLADSAVIGSGQPPLLMVSLFSNATDEHIDVLSLTNKIRANLAKSKKLRFINERLRGELAEEYMYEENGLVDPALAKQSGRQLGVDYLLSGHISSIRQPVGRREIVYYKTTMELTNLETGELAWTDEVEIKKTFKKRHVGR